MKKLLLFFTVVFAMAFMARAQESTTYEFEADLQDWTNIDADGDGLAWYSLNPTNNPNNIPGHNGSLGHVTSASYQGSALFPDNYFVSPVKAAYSSITFYACAQDNSWPNEHFGVAVSTNGNTDAADFTTIQEWTMTSKRSGVMSIGRDGQTRDQGTWYEYTVSFDAYADQDIWVAIRHFNCSDVFRLNIDDVTLTIGKEPTIDIIDFEDGNIPPEFTNDVTYPWTVVTADNGSQYCIKSGNTGIAASTSSISLTHQYPRPGMISFDAACWGEGTESKGTLTVWDGCEFYIDGERQFRHGALQSWDHYEYFVTAGEHTFTWSYSKDSSVNPTGDYMAVDNIFFNENLTCVAPTTITATGGLTDAHVSWNGFSESFTLEYKLTTESTWTSIPGLTGNEYAFTNIAEGSYDVRVQADCEAGNWVSTTFTVFNIHSTATWYGYAAYVMGTDDWADYYIRFQMGDLSNVTKAKTDVIPETWAAAYSDGYMWGITKDDFNLYKAPVDDDNHTIGEVEIVAASFDSEIAKTMSYNIVDNKMYYINDDNYLISFTTSDPVGTKTSVGHLDRSFLGLAVNAHGEAYGVEYSTGDLYRINLTSAQTTRVGATGVACNYVQDMAFDLTTGELFWAQLSTTSDNGVYIVNPQTADVAYLGQLGSQGVELTGMFMVYSGEGVNEIAYEDLSVYPNPAKDALYIDGIDGQTVSVYDAMGRLVMQEVYNGQLNVSALEEGIYAVTTGNRTVKFVKK